MNSETLSNKGFVQTMVSVEFFTSLPPKLNAPPTVEGGIQTVGAGWNFIMEQGSGLGVTVRVRLSRLTPVKPVLSTFLPLD